MGDHAGRPGAALFGSLSLNLSFLRTGRCSFCAGLHLIKQTRERACRGKGRKGESKAKTEQSEQFVLHAARTHDSECSPFIALTQRLGAAEPTATTLYFLQQSKVQEWRGVTHPQPGRARGQAYPSPETRTVDPSCVLCRTFALLAREGGFSTRDALPGAWAACARVAGASGRGPAV